jgi:phosphoenolpyruvate carboxykinase (GTP)
MTTNPAVLNQVDEIKALTKPEKVVWIDGSTEQIERLRQLAVDTGLITPLNAEKLPGCVLHRTRQGDAARAEARTFICTETKEEAGVANNYACPDEMHTRLNEMFDGVMSGRTMYVIPFRLGDRFGIEITDSVYVVLNTVILADCGADSKIPDSGFFFGVHSMGSEGVPTEDNRYICHFPAENAVWAINTGFGASAFLTKESFSLKLASCIARKEGWLAEHMAILEIETPGETGSEITYIAAAFPSGCGKTTLAMLDLPQSYAEKGYKVRCIGDDVAWLRKGKDGRLWAINPESGIFGLAPGLNAEKSPSVLASAQKNSIFTNVVHDTDNNTVWWEHLGSEASENLLDWKGNPWIMPEIPAEEDDDELEAGLPALEDAEVIESPDVVDSEAELAIPPVKVEKTVRGAHSNSRFTAPIADCPSLSPAYERAEGVPISAIIFGGRRSKTVPLVYQSFDWEHGVFVGSILGSETAGVNTVRRDPMAMLPYCGYNMADYWAHWLKMGKKLGPKAPRIFNVNWFKHGDDKKPVWPGYGENIRVLDWVVRRVTSSRRCGIVESPVGYLPKIEDIDLEGLPESFTGETVKFLLAVEKAQWKEDVNAVKQFYAKFGTQLPDKLREQLIDLEKRLLNY